MKTFDKKDVYSWFNREDAKKYINKKGYFAQNINQFNELIKEDPTIFLAIHEDNGACFGTTHYPLGSFAYCFFLPADKVKEVGTKKYRPFKNVDEFTHILGVSIGEILIIRPKKKTQQKGEIHTILVGYLKTENGDDGLIFGGSNGSWSLQDIFENLEWKSKRDDQWRVFGVEE